MGFANTPPPKEDWTPAYADGAHLAVIAMAALTTRSAITIISCAWKRGTCAAA